MGSLVHGLEFQRITITNALNVELHHMSESMPQSALKIVPIFVQGGDLSRLAMFSESERQVETQKQGDGIIALLNGQIHGFLKNKNKNC